MSKVITAQELSDKLISENPNITTSEMMIEFAKLHVDLCLKSAHTQASEYFDGRCWRGVYDTKFILKSYSEDKIK